MSCFIPEEVVEQTIVPIPMGLMATDVATVPAQTQSSDSSLKLKIKDISLCVTDQTSPNLLAKVLQVIADVK